MLWCDPYNLAWADSTQNSSSQSHKLILIKRGKADVFDGTSSITIITESVKVLLMERMLEFDCDSILDLQDTMSDNMKTENLSSGLATVSILNSRFEWIEWDRAIRKQLKIAGYGDLLKDNFFSIYILYQSTTYTYSYSFYCMIYFTCIYTCYVHTQLQA
jgi:hypothetical protein